MTEAKVDPIGLQCDKLHREGRPASLQAALTRKKDVDATARLVMCQQPIGSKKRGHTTTNMKT